MHTLCVSFLFSSRPAESAQKVERGECKKKKQETQRVGWTCPGSGTEATGNLEASHYSGGFGFTGELVILALLLMWWSFVCVCCFLYSSCILFSFNYTVICLLNCPIRGYPPQVRRWPECKWETGPRLTHLICRARAPACRIRTNGPRKGVFHPQCPIKECNISFFIKELTSCL